MIFGNRWKWKFEIAPMYCQVQAKPFTAKEQPFKIMLGLQSVEIFSGDRLPQIGESVSVPYFKNELIVRDIRSFGFGPGQSMKKSKYPVIVNLNPDEIGDADFWQVGREKMRTIPDWSWSTEYYPHNYRKFGHNPSDWVDLKLKFKERDFVLKWTKSGTYFVTPKGDELIRLDPKHKYLYEWFPEVEEHINKLTWNFSDKK